jgi:hypothetical protein
MISVQPSPRYVCAIAQISESNWAVDVVVRRSLPSGRERLFIGRVRTLRKGKFNESVRKLKPTIGSACKVNLAVVVGDIPFVEFGGAFAPPPACFDASCQSNKDFLFLMSLIGPVLLFILVSVWVLNRSNNNSSSEDANTFMDPETGVAFESPQGTKPARDRYGELAFKAVSWTPWPVDSETEGEAVRLEIGPVGSTVPRTFIFEKRYNNNVPSVIVVTQLQRPLGIVFEEGPGGEARVAELIPGGNADQLRRQTSLDPSLSKRAPRVGDILRACTATNVVYQTGALLFGAQPPQRTIVVYGADDQRWPNVAAALTRGLLADGKVTLVLERCLDPPEG